MNAPFLKATTETDLATIVRNLLAADDAFTAYVAGGVYVDAEWDRLEQATEDARQAYYDYMLNEHGLTKREVDALGRAA